MRKYKGYSKPLMAIEKFTPQEFIAGCPVKIIATPTSNDVIPLRIDLNGDGVFNIGERGSANIAYTVPVYTLNPQYIEVVDVNVYAADGVASSGTENYEVGFEYLDDVDQYTDPRWHLGHYRYDLIATKMLRYTFNNKTRYYFLDGSYGSQIEKNIS